MSQPHPEWLILLVTIVALALAPLASKLVRQVGDQVSGGIGGEDGSGDEGGDLREEIRQVIVAVNERRARMGEPPLDVEAEIARRLAADD